MRILVVNAGSSSLKLQLVEPDDRLSWQASVPVQGARFDTREACELLAATQGRVDAVGHRVVHGGPGHRGATMCDERTIARLRELVELAPLHQPAALEALSFARDAFPTTPHYCCFDTAFHASMPRAASTYALPSAWREQWGAHRFGFHGLSHAWVARRVPEMLGRPGDELRIVSCHLGAGASACAIARGRSVDTSMGFTPLAGLVMATRCGDLDPGLLLWLLASERVDLKGLAHALNHESGLQGLTGTADMRLVLQRRQEGDAQAELAVGIVTHRLRATVAAMAAAMNGLDVLAFTGGVGEHASALRGHAAAGLGFLGIALDSDLNDKASSDGEISASGAPVRTVVISAQEHLEIARQGRALFR